MSEIKEKLLDLMFPQKCVGCGKWGNFVCNDCETEIIFKEAQECPLCNAISKKGKYCPRCRPKSNATGIISVGYYKDPLIKELLHVFKYEGVFAISPFLGIWLAKKLKKEGLKFDLITFVPISRKRLSVRGFNQSELLAKELGKIFEKPVLKSLKKTKETKTQVGLKKKERLNNLNGAFELFKGAEINGKKVLIIDDVLTTGATLNECARVLRTAGAREVWGATIARE